MTPWLYVAGAIGAEIVATLSLRASDGFHRWPPAVLVVLGYCVSFFLLAQALRSLSVGLVYAIWSAVGTATVAVAGYVLFGDRIRWPGLIGIALVVVGVAMLSLSSAASRG